MAKTRVIANGSTLSFNGSSLEVYEISPSFEAAVLDRTQLSSSVKVYDAGLVDMTMEVTVIGVVTGTPSIGDTANLTWTPAGGTAQNMGTCVIVRKSFGGVTQDGRMTTSFTFRYSES